MKLFKKKQKKKKINLEKASAFAAALEMEQKAKDEKFKQENQIPVETGDFIEAWNCGHGGAPYVKGKVIKKEFHGMDFEHDARSWELQIEKPDYIITSRRFETIHSNEYDIKLLS